MGKRLFLLIVVLIGLLIDNILFFLRFTTVREINNVFYMMNSFVGLLFWIALTVYILNKHKYFSLSLLSPIFFQYIVRFLISFYFERGYLDINKIMIISIIQTFFIALILIINYLYKRSPILIVLVIYYITVVLVSSLQMPISIHYLIDIIKGVSIVLLLLLEMNQSKRIKSESFVPEDLL